MESINYTPAKIYPDTLDLSVQKWYVEYRYLNPVTLQKDRFKVYEDINRRSGHDKVAYALLLKDSVNQMLRDGYNPFAAEIEVIERMKQEKLKAVTDAVHLKPNYTVVQAANYFITEKKDSGKADSTIDRYKGHVHLFLSWMNERSLLLIKMSEVSAEQLLSFLREKSAAEEWSNKTYNNYLGTLQAWLNHLSKNIHGIIEKNPIEGAETKSTLSRKHAAYTDQHLSWILTAVRKRKDVFVEGLILTSYYACIRSKAEMIALRAGNILYDRDLLLLDAEGTKGRREDYVPLDPELKSFYISQGFEKLPPDWYIFGNCGKPGPLPATANYYSEKYKEYRDYLKLDDRYTLYGFKHTRGIHLANTGIDPYAIMQLYRHKSLDQTMTYLRDLGCTINRKATENSRKI
jgi:site-specific recombinase XerD